MKRSLGLVLLFLLGGASTATGQDAKDAVALDPTHHHVILENDHVRIFEVLAAPGDTSPMHTHPPLVVISLDKARLRMKVPDGSTSIFDLNPGQVLWLENVEHSWELLSGQVHLFAVEVKAANRSTASR
jgi:quercetin dioxygenase-like cupin family protein